MKKKIMYLFMVSVMILGLFSGCGATSAGGKDSLKDTAPATEAGSTPQKELVVHLGDQPSFFILKVANHLGYFEEEFKDTNVTISVDNFVNQGSAIIEAMTSGDVQLGVVGALPTVAAISNGKPFIAISSVNYSEDGFKLFAGADSGIKTVKDFTGKKIAVKFSSNEHQMVLTLLKNAGLSTKDVEIVNMSAEDSLNSLITKNVDGALLRGDQLNTAIQSGANIIADNSESGIIANYLIARDDFAEAYPEVITGVLKVLDKAKKWIDANEAQTVDIFVSLTNADPASAKTSFESRERSISIDEEIFTGPLTQSIEFSLEQGLIDNKITIEDVIDTSYFENSGLGN